MELKELVGEHVLDAVDFSNEQVKTWGDEFEDCQVMRIRLDGIVYIATEDHDDGYRSRMNNIVTANSPHIDNIFPPVRVVARYRTRGEYGGNDDVLEFIAVENGEVVAEIGTADTDYYYPYFVATFNPGAMPVNK